MKGMPLDKIAWKTIDESPEVPLSMASGRLRAMNYLQLERSYRPVSTSSMPGATSSTPSLPISALPSSSIYHMKSNSQKTNAFFFIFWTKLTLSLRSHSRSHNSELLHAELECGAVHAEARCGATRSCDKPPCPFQGVEDVFAFSF